MTWRSNFICSTADPKSDLRLPFFQDFESRLTHLDSYLYAPTGCMIFYQLVIIHLTRLLISLLQKGQLYLVYKNFFKSTLYYFYICGLKKRKIM